MTKNIHIFLTTLALMAFFCGCVSRPTDNNALKLAVDQSNDSAQRQFNVAPFTRDSGKLWMAGNHWVWDAKVSSDGHTYVSHVSFNRNSTPETVDVHRQD